MKQKIKVNLAENSIAQTECGNILVENRGENTSTYIHDDMGGSQ